MRQPKWIQDGIRLGNQFHYRKKNVLIHNVTNMGLFFSLLLIATSMLFVSRQLPPLAYLLVAPPTLGIVFFCMIILVIHEASHGMFIITKERNNALRWNRFFGWIVSIPFGINYARHWEEGHHIHHIHPVEPDDPQTVNLWTGQRFIREFFLMLLLPGYVFLWNPSRQYKTQKWLGPTNLLFWAGLLATTALNLNWAVPVALVLALGVLGALNQMKGSLEHGGEIATEANRNLRSRTSLFPLRRLIMPFNISLHFEHHLNYCVPWYDLLKYHRELRKLVPVPVQSEIFNTRIADQLMGRLGKLTQDVRHLVDASEVEEEDIESLENSAATA